MSAPSPTAQATGRLAGYLLCHVEQLVETADLARRTNQLQRQPRPWARDGYHDGEFHAALSVLAFADYLQAAGLEQHERRRNEEEAASLGRRVLVALHNEADELRLFRFSIVTSRARHAHTRARPCVDLATPASEQSARALQEVG
jgi:hypothetical protein